VNSTGAMISMGHIVTDLALHYGAFDPSTINMLLVEASKLHCHLLFRVEIITGQNTLRAPKTCKCYHLGLAI